MHKNNLRPYAYQFLGRVLPQFVGIGVSAAMVACVGIEGFGKYSLIISLITITYGVLGAALDTDYQRSHDADGLRDVLEAKTFAWIVFLPFFVLASWVLGFGFWVAVLLYAGFFFQQLIESRTISNRISNEDEKTVLPRLLPVLAFFAVLHWARPKDLEWLALGFASSWFLFSLPLIPLYAKLRWHVVPAVRKLKSVAAIWASLVLTQVYGNVDLYLIKFFHSDADVGAYKLAYTFASMAMPVAGVFSFIYLSKITGALSGSSPARAADVFRKQVFIAAALGVSLMLFMLVPFPCVFRYLYGAQGEGAIVPAQVLSVAMSLNIVSMILSYSLLALREDKVIAKLTGVGVFFYAALSLFLIPGYAAMGAAIAMCASYLILLLFYAWVFYRNRSLWPIFEGGVKGALKYRGGTSE